MTSPSFACPHCRSPLSGRTRVVCEACRFELEFRDGLWRDPALAQPPGFSPDRREHLSSIERRHFWFRPRDRLLARLAHRHLHAGGAALELGCGSGRLLPVWDGLFASTTAVEPYARSLEEAADRGTKATLVQADVCRLPFEEKQFDAILAFDVLEHVEGDAMLAQARLVARNGARLLVSVPACKSLWSYADETAGHRCRYDLTSLRPELEKNGWKLLGHTHYQFILFPLIWLSRRLIGKRGRSAERDPSRAVAAVLGGINTMEVALGAGFRLPFGSSLIVWAVAA